MWRKRERDMRVRMTLDAVFSVLKTHLSYLIAVSFFTHTYCFSVSFASKNSQTRSEEALAAWRAREASLLAAAADAAAVHSASKTASAADLAALRATSEAELRAARAEASALSAEVERTRTDLAQSQVRRLTVPLCCGKNRGTRTSFPVGSRQRNKMSAFRNPIYFRFTHNPIAPYPLIPRPPAHPQTHRPPPHSFAPHWPPRNPTSPTLATHASRSNSNSLASLIRRPHAAAAAAANTPSHPPHLLPPHCHPLPRPRHPPRHPSRPATSWSNGCAPSASRCAR
jgi:hypothetical protein